MCDIDDIMDLISWNSSEEDQAKGLEMAKEIKSIRAFLQPADRCHGKDVWDNCAKILSDRSDEELKPYLCQLLEWLQDLNWPGALCILERMKQYADQPSFALAFDQCMKRAQALKYDVWIENLREIIGLEKYVFFSRGGLPMPDEDYQQLLTACCKHASYISLLFHPNQLERPDPAHTRLLQSCCWQEEYEYRMYDTVRHIQCVFPCTEDTIQFVRTRTGNLFQWGHDNPEDLTFYRDDHTILMELETHEGRCQLYPTEEEKPDFQQIVKNHGWLSYTGNTPIELD